MLNRLEAQSPDALLALIKLFNADPRPDKIDLGVGVYRTADGATPFDVRLVLDAGLAHDAEGRQSGDVRRSRTRADH